MTFLNAFFLVNFLPWGLITLAGILLFFRGNYQQEKWYYPLLFIIVVLAVISLWRIPLLRDRRYAMPIIVPGIVVSSFVLMILPGILNKFKVSHAKAMTRVIIIVLLIACVAKTMRVQENKDYLHDISEVIKSDCRKNNIKRNAALLVFGNPGGRFNLDNNVDEINAANRHYNSHFADVEFQFANLDTEYLKASHPLLYLLCAEPESGSFAAAWKNKFIDNPELVFEYVNRKQIAYRLYRVVSQYKSAWMTSDELEHLLTNENNLLQNGDFKRKYRILPQDNISKILQERGIKLSENTEVYLPDGWVINPGHGWAANCSPVSIKFIEENNTLNVQSKDMISIYSQGTLDSGKTYLIAAYASSESQGCFMPSVYTYDENDKYIRTINLKGIELSNKGNRYLIPFTLKNHEKGRLALLFSGDVSIRNVTVLPAEMVTK